MPPRGQSAAAWEFGSVTRLIHRVMTPRILPPTYPAAENHNPGTMPSSMASISMSSVYQNASACNLETANYPFNYHRTLFTNYQVLTTASLLLSSVSPSGGALTSTVRQNKSAAVSLAMVMPRPEILKFDEDPKQYHQFVHNFESNIESNVTNANLRLAVKERRET